MTKQKNKSIVNLIATISNEQYLIGILNFFNKQFSYFFSYPIEAPEIQFNFETQKLTSRMDHITFHTNRMHIRYLDKKLDPIEIVYYQHGPLILEQPILTPLYVESIYFDEKPCLKKLSDFTPWKESQSQNILTLETSKGFSLIFILAPASHPTWVILSGFKAIDIHPSPCLSNLVDFDHRTERIALWGDWDLIIITTAFKCEILSSIPDSIKPGFRLSNYKNVPAALTNLMKQATINRYQQ